MDTLGQELMESFSAPPVVPLPAQVTAGLYYGTTELRLHAKGPSTSNAWAAADTEKALKKKGSECSEKKKKVLPQASSSVIRNWHHKTGNSHSTQGLQPIWNGRQRHPGQVGWAELAGSVLRDPSLSLSTSVLSDSISQFLLVYLYFFPFSCPHHSSCKSIWIYSLKWQEWCLYSSL